MNPAIQSVKYWDLAAPEYDFVAISGLPDDTRITSATENRIAVDQTNFGQIFVSDRVTAKYQASATGETSNTQYGHTVEFTFKRLAARVRLGIYETVPGYAVKNVKFYYDDNYLAARGTSNKTVAGMQGRFPVSGDVVVNYDGSNRVQADFQGSDVANNFQFGELDYTIAASNLLDGSYMMEDGTTGPVGDASFLSTTSAIPTWAKKDAVLDGAVVVNTCYAAVVRSVYDGISDGNGGTTSTAGDGAAVSILADDSAVANAVCLDCMDSDVAEDVAVLDGAAFVSIYDGTDIIITSNTGIGQDNVLYMTFLDTAKKALTFVGVLNATFIDADAADDVVLTVEVAAERS